MSASWPEIREEALAGMPRVRRVWFHLIRWAVLFAVALITYLAFPSTGSQEVPVYQIGAVAQREVVAPTDLVFWEKVTQYIEPPARRSSQPSRPLVIVDSLRHVIRAGDRIVSLGETVTRDQSLNLSALSSYVESLSEGVGLLRSVGGPILFNCLVLSTFWLLLMFYRWETYSSLREMLFFGFVFTLVIGSAALVSRLLPGRPELIPVPFAAILVTLIYNGRLGLYAATMLAVLLGSQWALRDADVLFITLISGVAAAVGTRAARRRKELYFTLGATIIAYGLVSLTLGLMHGWVIAEMGWSAMRGAVTALGSASVSMLLLPVAESATHVTTDITLLELSDQGRPLLRRLAQDAPGTYAHSLAMASLCEPACNAIGANGLLARVGCYYHDLGKSRHPDFFVENQRPGQNPHDSLDPRESAAIVRNHVIDGMALAREAGLPERIVAFIPEHHGTQYIEYFLDRARKDGGNSVDPEEFRYPGPRPRSAETAIVMLADATEAALRLLGDPTVERVRGAVDFLIQEKLDSGQLRDAPLTLSELDRVKEEFVRVMSSMRHVRVEYPGNIGGIAARFPQEKKPENPHG
ncbi:MAG: HDIG domain-containing metalloprotein [Gemmatimonadota bacterium]